MELKMMLKRISFMIPILLLLIGTHVFAQNTNNTPIFTATATSTTNETALEKENVKVNENSKVKTASVLTQEAEPVKASFKDYAIPLVVSLLIVIGVSSYWLFYRRKHV
jgi:carbohydrate-binding DOMON domain-containing protein